MIDAGAPHRNGTPGPRRRRARAEAGERARLPLLFIVGDILGAGIHAGTGEMALEGGGLVWLPFVVAVAVVPAGDLERVAGAEGQVLLSVVRLGAGPGG